MDMIIKQYMPENVLESENREDGDQTGIYLCREDQNNDDAESTAVDGAERKNQNYCNYCILTFLTDRKFSGSRTRYW